jgi:uncharacterized protein YhfF
LAAFWQAYLGSLPQDSPARRQAMPNAWGFGDSSAMAGELGRLVYRGTKTATCSLLWEYQADGEPLPQAGELSIILDGGGHPLCVIETIEVEVKPFDAVDAPFAHAEGEGDRSLAYWRAAHWSYFSRVCERMQRRPEDDMPLVCERFRVVFRG